MNKPKSLYIHIPFCEHICAYCDFPKLQYFSNFADKYLSALENEFSFREVSKDLETIYIGGGTPTSLSNEQLERLLSFIYPYTSNVKEYTIEANPESLSIDKLKIMKEYGVNRISIGVESTDDKILALTNRHHTFDDVKKAVTEARNMGIDNLNLDLIIGLPHVSLSGLKADLDNLLSLKPNHISCYSLTVHPNTVFGINKINEPEPDFVRETYDYIDEKLSKEGFIHYEVSNFALPGYESKHNYVYWKNEQYYGLGMGAAGYIGSIRYTNTKSIDKYMNCNYDPEEEIVDVRDDISYSIILCLRTVNGLNLTEIKDKFGVDIYLDHKQYIDDCIKNNFLILSDNVLKPTYQGMMILDQIILNLIY